MSILNQIFRVFSKDARKGVAVTPMAAFEAASKSKALIVDVREMMEIQKGMAEPAIWLATTEIEANSNKALNFIASLPKNKTIMVYCGAGVRAGRFIDILSAQGFKTANLGGFSDWVAAGLPVRKP